MRCPRADIFWYCPSIQLVLALLPGYTTTEAKGGYKYIFNKVLKQKNLLCFIEKTSIKDLNLLQLTI